MRVRYHDPDTAAAIADDDRLMGERREIAARSYMQKSSAEATSVADDEENALQPAPEPEAHGFSEDDPPPFDERQKDAVAEMINELRAEFHDDIERATQQLLGTMVRMVLPGEIAEQKIYGLSDRLAIMERQIERRLAEAEQKSGNNTVVELPGGFLRRRDVA